MTDLTRLPLWERAVCALLMPIVWVASRLTKR
jgi:hypothetical protein